ncbi:acyl-CoA synthetase [Actinoplanes sp. NPDC051851]|uniref:acyl-CoA synthetase n=1 Tax=Actinoplanes sp. NPDC051851 TaxID=3154753 RepID=UPI003419D5CD
MAANIADLFEHAVDAFPDRVAVACGERTSTYAELESSANRLAHVLRDHGLGPGDHIGLLAGNSIEAVAALLAVYKLRAVAVNINYRYVENELQYLFTDAELTALLHDPEFAGRVANVRPAVPALRVVVPLVAGEWADADPGRDFGTRSGDDVYLLYTGGTTGYPKGVIWRQEDVWRALGGGIDFMSGIPLADEWAQTALGAESGGMVRLCLAPLIHGNAQWAALAALFAGDTVVMLPRFDPGATWQAVERHRVNAVVLIGDAMARPLIDAYRKGSYDASSLAAVTSSAALFSPVVKREYMETFPTIMITDAIGSSETGFAGIGVVADVAGGAVDGPRVMPGRDTIVIDEYGHRAPPGVIGRLARGGHLPLGYFKDEAKTKALFTQVDGVRYAVPGDFARLEDDGTITLLGRGNTCVNTGGEKVFPEEVEGALKAHPGVFDVLVIGAADDLLGQRVAALIQTRSGVRVDPADLDAHVRARLAGYKAPRSVWFVDRIERTISGKADYRWAHEYARTHTPEDRHAD